MSTRTRMQPGPPAILRPCEAADRLGLTVPGLVALLRHYRYKFTELAAGGRPGDRGRNRWGLTEAQITAILRGQERGFREPEPKAPADMPRVSAVSPDGKSRLQRGRASRA